MPQPLCDTCGKGVTPNDRVTVPTELNDAGVMVHPSTSWHKGCLENEEDAQSEVEEGPDPGHEEDPGWSPH
jgi:hypothetical protein